MHTVCFPKLGLEFHLNPVVFSIGDFQLNWYGVLIGVGILLAMWMGFSNCKRFGIIGDKLVDVVLAGIIGGIVGARLYYVAFRWEDYKDDLSLIFRTWEGGLAIYGGIIGAILALWIRCRMKGWSIFPALDVMSFGLFIGQSIGRWGNFFNREAFGYETDIFCRMGLTLNGSTVYVHPTFLYESLWNAVGFVAMHFYSKRHRKYKGQFFLLYVFWYGLGRAMIEGLRSDSLWLIPDVIRVSQLLAAATCVAALALLIINSRRVKAGAKPLFGHSLDSDDIIIEESPAEESAPEEETEAGENEKTTESNEQE